MAYQTVFSQFGAKLQLALDLCASEFPHVGETVGILVRARFKEIEAGRLELLAPLAPQLEETGWLRPGVTGQAALARQLACSGSCSGSPSTR